ncbi:MAG: response regulator [Campylobacterota bacterium]|nr:response regulator [Campylobacterota bacterium]
MDNLLINQLKHYTLLFVENEKGIRENFYEYFLLLFKNVYIAKDGLDGFELYTKHTPDLIISDIKMDNMDGITLIQKIRAKDKDTSIVIISAHTDVDYLLNSIELNLLKYIVKPLTHDKLENIFYKFVNEHNVDNDISLKIHNNTVKFDNQQFELSLKETLFLNKLIKENRVITYEEIENEIWDNKHMSQNALRLFIKNLRKKLPKDFIKNIPNFGYSKRI